MKFFTIFAVALIAAASLVYADSCNIYASCSKCVANPACGWCSEPLVGPGEHGQCGKPSTSNLTCKGIFSTEKCSAGYVCNHSSMTCTRSSAPGAGQSKDQCEKNCSTVGKTYYCDNTTFNCVECAPTHPDANSFQQCHASCHRPTTSSPNHTRMTETHSNHTHTHNPHSHTPHPTSTTSTGLYKCDPATAQCVPAAVGEGTSKIVCEQNCRHKHNHTPSDLLGLWRGFAVSNEAFTADEYDWNFQDQGKVSFTHSPGTILSGTIATIADSFTADFGSGKEISCIYKQSLTQPTTYEMMFACAQGKVPPKSFDDAMSGTDATVTLASRCVDPTICKFEMNAGPKPKSSFFKSLTEKVDRCTAFTANCTYCLAHKCGWCGVPVVFPNGRRGVNCANPSPGQTWKCYSSYSTSSCPVKKIGYLCNVTAKTCYKGPGGAPTEHGCLQACHAKPGPPSQLAGKWRGIIISQKYLPGVLQIEMNSSSFNEVLPTGEKLSGKVSHYAQYLYVTLNKIGRITCLWSTHQNDFVEYATFACSAPGAAAPKDFDGPMAGEKAGTENLFAKCIGSECKWN